MIPYKTIEIAQNTPACPKCAWKPAGIEGSARYAELIAHVHSSHDMGSPTFIEKTVFVTGHGAQGCEVAVFTNL